MGRARAKGGTGWREKENSRRVDTKWWGPSSEEDWIGALTRYRNSLYRYDRLSSFQGAIRPRSTKGFVDGNLGPNTKLVRHLSARVDQTGGVPSEGGSVTTRRLPLSPKTD